MANMNAGSNNMLVVAVVLLAGCSRGPGVELKRYALDDISEVITRTDVGIDKTVSSDGKGSLKITALKPVIVRIAETGDIDAENTQLTYRARVRTEGLEGQAYLEMYACFAVKGEFFSRGLDAPLSGTREWATVEIPFLLRKGENPDNVKLNIVVNGKGTVWVDDIRLFKR